MAVGLRLAGFGDGEAVAEIYRPFVETTIVSFELAAPDGEQIADRIAHTLVRFPWLICEWDGVVAGYAYASRHRDRKAYQWSVDCSAYVHPDYWRRKIGRALYTSLFEILAAQGYINAYAGIALPNPASVGLHEAVGFRPVGVYRSVGYKLGAWHDVGWWELALQAHKNPPEEPLDLATIQRRADWEELLSAGLQVLSEGTRDQGR